MSKKGTSKRTIGRRPRIQGNRKMRDEYQEDDRIPAKFKPRKIK